MAYGWSRFKASLQSGAGLQAAAQADAAFEAFVAYQGRQARRDDFTLIDLDISPLPEV
jgi:serine phosphatase RsbU (regulator of sigma subunit)